MNTDKDCSVKFRVIRVIRGQINYHIPKSQIAIPANPEVQIPNPNGIAPSIALRAIRAPPSGGHGSHE